MELKNDGFSFHDPEKGPEMLKYREGGRLVERAIGIARSTRCAHKNAATLSKRERGQQIVAAAPPALSPAPAG